MTLVTLSGTVSAADLENNFGDKVASLPGEDIGAFPVYYHVDCRDLAVATATSQRVVDFVAPDDMQIQDMFLSMWNPDATSRTVTLGLSAIDGNQAVITKMFPSDPLLSVTVASASEANASRGEFPPVVYLVKGITYRLTLTRTDANAGVIDRAFGGLIAASVRRTS